MIFCLIVPVESDDRMKMAEIIPFGDVSEIWISSEDMMETREDLEKLRKRDFVEDLEPSASLESSKRTYVELWKWKSLGKYSSKSWLVLRLSRKKPLSYFFMTRFVFNLPLMIDK